MAEKSFDEHLSEMRAKPDEDLLAYDRLPGGGMMQKSATKVLKERKDAIEERRHQEIFAIAQKRAERHDLITFWKLSDWQEKIGMVSIYSGVFFFGYLCAKMSFVSRLIDLIRDVTP